MAYQKQSWVNNNKNTPLSAERLTHIENGIQTVEKTLNDAIRTETNGRVLGDSILEGLITRLEDSTYNKKNLPFLNIGAIEHLSIEDVFNLLYWNTNLADRTSLLNVNLSYYGINYYQKVDAIFNFSQLNDNEWQVTITLQDSDKMIKFVKTTGNSWSRYIFEALFHHDITFTIGDQVCNLTFITHSQTHTHNISELLSLFSTQQTPIFVTGTLNTGDISQLIFGANYVPTDRTLYLLVFPKQADSYDVLALDSTTTYTNFYDFVISY